MDPKRPPSNTLLLVNELIKAQQGFPIADAAESPITISATSQYMVRRRSDYFVKNLLGAEPPHEYQMKPRPVPALARAVLQERL